MAPRWYLPFGSEQLSSLLRLTAISLFQTRLNQQGDPTDETAALRYELAWLANSRAQRAREIGPATPRGVACCRLAVELLERAEAADPTAPHTVAFGRLSAGEAHK